jgi:hypothetical protein
VWFTTGASNPLENTTVSALAAVAKTPPAKVAVSDAIENADPSLIEVSRSIIMNLSITNFKSGLPRKLAAKVYTAEAHCQKLPPRVYLCTEEP